MTTNDIEIRVSVKNNSAQGLDAAERQAKERGDRIASHLARAGEKAGEALDRGITRRLGDTGDKGRSAIGRLFDGIADQASNAADAAGKSLAQIPVALSGLVSSTVASGGVNLLVLALLGLAAAAATALAGLIVLAPAVYLVAGSFGAATTAGVGLASVIGTLIVGLGGIGDAWSAAGQKASGGGRSAADAAYQVRQATLALADAQRAALRAQEDVTRARMDEQERLEDLSRTLAGARLDEEGAVLAVAQAEQRLRDVRRNRGSALDYREADLNLRKAKQSLEEVRDRVGDLSQEQAEADRRGVEGSERVQDALEAQRQAQRQIEAATHALAQAQRGAGGGVDRFAEAMAKLSPNAQAFVRSLLQIKERFDGIKRSTQDRLFDGWDKTVERLASRSFPTLERILGGTAASLNRVAKGAAEALGDKTFLSNIELASAAFDRTLDRIGEKTLPKLIGAFGRLARASIPFWEELSDMALGWIEKFSDKIATLDEDGKLDEFFEDAAESLGKIRDIGGTALKIIGQVVGILFKPSKRESGEWLDGIATRLHEISDWLADEKNQQKIQDWITDLQDFRDGAVETATKLAGIIDKVDGWVESVDKFVKKWQSVPSRIGGAIHNIWAPLKDSFKTAMNWIIDRWNGLELRLPSVNWFGQTIGGGSIGTPNIDRFDHGGIVGGRLAMVAERKREAISMPGGGTLLALPQGSMVHPNGATERMLGGGAGGVVRVVIDLIGADAELRRRIQKITKVTGGGNVQVAFGDGKTR